MPLATTPFRDGPNGPAKTRPPRLARQTPPTPQAPSPEQREAQEVEAPRTFPVRLLLRGTLEGHQTSLVRLEGQSITPQPLRQHFPHALGVFPALERDDEIIRVPDQTSLAVQARHDFPVKPPVENVVQVDVAQQRRQDRPLGRADVRSRVLRSVQHPHMQTLADQSQQRPISHPLPKHLQQLRAIDAVEEGRNVRLQDPVQRAPFLGRVQGPNRVVSASPGPKAVRAVQKVWLVHRLQHRADGVLDDLVLERRNAQRPSSAVALGDVDPPDRLMAVALRLQPLVQVLQVAQQFLRVVLLRDPIHAHRGVDTLAVERAKQGWHVDQMRQRVELAVGFSSGSFRYLLEFRGHAFPDRSLAHVSLPKFVISRAAFAPPGPGSRPVPRLRRYCAALRLPCGVGRGFGSPRTRPTSERTPRTDRGLPGYRTPLFAACRSRPPRREKPRLALFRRSSCCLQGRETPGLPEWSISRLRSHGPPLHLSTHQPPGCPSGCKTGSRPAGLGFGRTGFAPAGERTEFQGVIARLLSHRTDIAWPQLPPGLWNTVPQTLYRVEKVPLRPIVDLPHPGRYSRVMETIYDATTSPAPESATWD